MRDHPVYQDEAVQSWLDYCRTDVAPKMDPALVVTLNEKIEEMLGVVAELYDQATASVDSRRLY